MDRMEEVDVANETFSDEMQVQDEVVTQKKPQAERVSISIALLNDVVSVLASMPYKNVANIMEAIQRDVRQL